MATVTRWNPVRDMITMREAMDRIFADTYRGREAQNGTVWQLPIDAYADSDKIVLVVDVPGLKPEELQITLEGDVLSIKGEFKPTTEQRNYLVKERLTGRFERTLTVNTPIDNNKVEAVFDNGILTLTLPKAEAVKPKQITVKAK